MKITVELSDSEMRQVREFTGEVKKGPAVRKLVIDVLTLKRREQMAQQFIDGRTGVELRGFEQGRAADRKAAAGKARKWRANARVD
jgi:hypothetical protein